MKGLEFLSRLAKQFALSPAEPWWFHEGEPRPIGWRWCIYPCTNAASRDVLGFSQSGLHPVPVLVDCFFSAPIFLMHQKYMT